MRKIAFAGIELTSQRVRGLRGTSELPGRPVAMRFMAQIVVINSNLIQVHINTRLPEYSLHEKNEREKVHDDRAGVTSYQLEKAK